MNKPSKLEAFKSRAYQLVGKVLGIASSRAQPKITNAIKPGLALPSKDRQQRSTIYNPAQTRDVSRADRNEAVAISRLLDDQVSFVHALNNGLVDLALGDAGMVPTFQSSDRDYNKRAAAYCQAAWRRQTWDVTGNDNGASMQRLVLRSMIVDGEIFGAQILSQYGTSQQQLVVTEQIGGTWSPNKDGLIDGIEYNAYNRATRYFIDDLTSGYGSSAKPSIPVEARYMRHVYNRIRPTQKRGLPWGYTGTKHGLATLDIAQLIGVTIRMNASVIGTMTTPNGAPPSNFDELIGLSEGGADKATSSNDSTAPTANLDIHGAIVPIFKAGEGINFLQGRSAANEIEFLRWLAEQYANGLGLPYDTVGSISTGGAATNANADIVGRFLKKVQRIITDDWNQPTTEALLSNGIVAYYFPGLLPGVEPLQPPEVPSEFAMIEWRGPRGYQVNPTRDANSNIMLMRASLKTRADYWSELGKDPILSEQTIMEELKERAADWLAQGWPIERFWQKEFGPSVQGIHAPDPTGEPAPTQQGN